MIRALARFSVANPVAVNLLSIAICVAGFLAYDQMAREVFPVFSMRTVEVSTFFPGAAPEDVERLVTLPIEDAVEGLDGLRELTSRTSEGLSVVSMKLGRDIDPNDFVEEVRSQIQLDVELPEEVEEPRVREMKTTFPVIAVFVYGWESEGVLRDEAEVHTRALEGLNGVSNVVVTGRREPRLWIEVDPLALERYGMSLEEVGQIVGAKVTELPLGSLQTDSGDYLLRVEGEVESAEDLFDLPLRAGPSGRVIRLQDVATARDTYERWVTRARFNGRPCIYLRVDKESGGDLIEIADEVHDYVAGVQDRLPAGVAVGTNSDLSIYVKNRLRVMANSGTIGAVLVLLALIAVLNARVALMTALGIPISFLGGLVLAAAFGVSMNMMTMFALIVVLGMIVDDAIVVGENGYRLMEEGMSPEEAAVEGTVQVGAPVVATILTSVSAFLPILVMTGVTGEFLRPLPLVVTFCLLVSMVEALLILPSHLAHWSGRRQARQAGGSKGESPRFYDGFRAAYQRFLARCLHWRYVTLTVAMTALVLLVSYAQSRVPFHLFDDFESKILSINMRTPAGTSLDDTEEIAIAVEELVLQLPEHELESVNLWAGVSALDANRFTVAQNLAQIWVELREGTDRRSTPAIIEDLRSQLSGNTSGIEALEIQQPQSGPTGRAIDLWIRGGEDEALAAVAAEVKERLGQFDGVRDVSDNLELGKKEVSIVLSDHARGLGLSEAALSAQLRTAFEGSRVGRLRRGTDDVELVVKLPEALRRDRSVLESMRVSLPTGERVPLRSVAELRESRGPSVITRDGRERAVNVIADVNKQVVSADAVTRVLQEEYAELELRYPGTTLEFKGDQQDTAESLEGLGAAGLISLCLIYVILGSLFRSFSQPFVVMFIIPFAASGMIVGHVVMGRDLTLMSLIGLLALAGVVVNDSLILIDFVNVRKRTGLKTIPALVDAGRTRFRPIVLTTVTTMLGLTPLTFFASGQARFLQPMAISFFYGLLFATVLVLVLVPCAYAVLDDLLHFRLRRREAGSLTSAASLDAT